MEESKLNNGLSDDQFKQPKFCNSLYERLCQIYPPDTAKHVMRTHTETDLRYRLGMDWLKKNNSPSVSGSLEEVLAAIFKHFTRR